MQADLGGSVAAGSVDAYHSKVNSSITASSLTAAQVSALLTVAYHGVHQSAYGTGTQAGCSTSAGSACSGRLEAFSFDADYRFNVHFDAYVGAMYSGVRDGLASGYLHTTNLNPTLGGRYKF